MKNSIFDIKECPMCGYNLDDGDIYETLKKLNEYKKFTNEEIKKLAENYGWSESNKKRFSKIIGEELKYFCPECKLRIKP